MFRYSLPGSRPSPLATTTDAVTGSIHLIGGATFNLTGSVTPPYGPLNDAGAVNTQSGTWTGSGGTSHGIWEGGTGACG